VEHVLCIGGPPASGKTTVGTRLARRYGLRLYRADTRTWVHRDRALRAGSLPAQRWESLTPADRWTRSTPAEMLEMSLHRERGAMVMDDLATLPTAPMILAEGSPLPATAVSSGIIEPTQAVWLVPTTEFQRARLDAAATPDGHARLYRLLRDVIEREAHDNNVAIVTVDGSKSVSEITAIVDRRFAAALAHGPRAGTISERQTLLREMNDAVIEQIRGYHARPWAGGDPEAVAPSFVCECGQPACDADVSRTVGEVSAGPAYARGHHPHPFHNPKP
jgi:hypothetical protein